MLGEEALVGMILNEEGGHAIARVGYRLRRDVAIDGFEIVTGEFSLQEELCPLHTGLARLVPEKGEPSLVRIVRVSRPAGDGEFEVIGPLDRDGSGRERPGAPS
ncbi:MAG: hypothetical protein K6V36_00065 [Anaerolineae bacterium]|nr:hypothetical protein [Anaerolineae bacterium]